MKVVFVLAILVCAAELVYSDLVCGRNYCTKNPCTAHVPAKACHSPSVYRENHAGKCACCPACVTFLPEGAQCKTYSKELGETPNAICEKDLKCLIGVCTRVPPKKN